MQLLFYNCENLFDPSDNPLTDDDEYTPDGIRHWTSVRQYAKVLNIAKVILAAGEGQAPAIVGLAEVETDSCLFRLTHQTSLREYGYDYIITQSQDTRGINVALLYQADDYRVLGHESLRVQMPAGFKPTRDMLHAWGRVVGGDTLDVIVCHLPSRRGGAAQSAPARKAAHRRLRTAIDSLEAVRQHPHIAVMGDMNDDAALRSLRRNMGFGQCLHNLMLPLHRQLLRGKQPYGTHKYQGEWSILDQLWVDDGLLPSPGNRLWISDVRIVCYPFMLVDDHLGHRPMRSFYGYTYEGGFSDHLPIAAQLHIRF